MEWLRSDTKPAGAQKQRVRAGREATFRICLTVQVDLRRHTQTSNLRRPCHACTGSCETYRNNYTNKQQERKRSSDPAPTTTTIAVVNKALSSPRAPTPSAPSTVVCVCTDRSTTRVALSRLGSKPLGPSTTKQKYFPCGPHTPSISKPIQTRRSGRIQEKTASDFGPRHAVCRGRTLPKLENGSPALPKAYPKHEHRVPRPWGAKAAARACTPSLPPIAASCPCGVPHFANPHTLPRHLAKTIFQLTVPPPHGEWICQTKSSQRMRQAFVGVGATALLDVAHASYQAVSPQILGMRQG